MLSNVSNDYHPSTRDLASNPLLLDQLLAPMGHVFENYCRARRDCSGISDPEFLRLGILRTLSQSQSGRDFLQQQNDLFGQLLARATFFNALHSPRRRDLAGEVSRQLCQRSRPGADEDLLQAFPELKSRPVLAVDGHQIEHACHALKDPQGRQVSTNSLYLLCLHSSLLLNLAPVQGDGRYQHEMAAFRRALPGFLQNQAQPLQAPLLVLDPAFVDNAFWTQHQCIRRSGAGFITRLKDNMNPQDHQARPWDAADRANTGVEGDWLVTFPSGIQLRLVQYSDPETGACFQFLTSELKLRPGVIAWLYFLRWRIEKVFDTAKNKLQETKAWAGGQTAQAIQGHFLALTHNLLVLFRGFLRSEHGLEEQKLKAKRTKELEQRSQRAEKQGRQLHPLQFKMPLIVQLSVQFIRALRNHIIGKATLRAALPHIRAMLSAYL